VIVCGLHGVGLRTVEQLYLAGVPVVVVDDDPDPRLPSRIASWGVPLIATSARLPETLTAAGLTGAAALVCVEADDLHTLETALLAGQLRPGVRVVVQLRNPAVGRAIAGTGAAVLDVAGLSAPSVVEACLRTEGHDLELGGERFVLVRSTATRHGTLRELYGDLAPIAVLPADPAPELVICPGRDHQVRPGDLVAVLGTATELDRHRVRWRADTDDPAPMGSRFHRPSGLLGHLAGSLVQAADRRLGGVLLALFGLATVSITVLRLGYREPDGSRMSLLDAIYFTVETIGTIGYGDFSFRQQPVWLRVFAVALMISGVVLATTCFALLTNLLVSRRIEESLGHRLVTRLSGHVVVIGLGSIGVQVVERLRGLGHGVVVIEADEQNRYLAQIRGTGVPVVIGDATVPQILRVVNLAEARAVAVLTSDDLVNLEAGLAVLDQLAGRWREVPVVLRMFDRGLAAAVERGFAFEAVRSTAALAAPWFVGAALGLEVLSTFYVADQPLLVGRLQVRRGGRLAGLAMQDLSARLRVVALQRAGDGVLEHPPRRDTRFAEGDVAFLVGPYEELLQVLRRDTPAPTAPITRATGPDHWAGRAYLP
jgi:Trk K+ transport system NAD-binding subunit